MNIVAAIRDLPENTVNSGNQPHSGFCACWWPVLLLVGILLLLNGESFERDTIRIAATLIAAGLSFFRGHRSDVHLAAQRTGAAARLHFFGRGPDRDLGLPWPAWFGLSDSLFDQDPSLALLSFILTGPLVILGAILVIIFNADAWLGSTASVWRHDTLTPVLRPPSPIP